MSRSWSSHMLRWPPVVLLAAGVAFDLATPSQYTGDPLFAAACVLVGATQGWRATVLASVAAVMAMAALSAGEGEIANHRGIADISSVAFAGLIALGVNRALGIYGKRLATVRSVAEAAQRALLPDPPHRLGPLSIAARYDAASSDARIGGDIYAAQASPYGIRLLIGDVRGKGIGAIGAVAVLLGAFREAADDEPDLPRLAARLDRALERHKAQAGEEARLEGFTTGLLVEYADDGGTLRMVNRGHPPPYLLTPDGAVCALDPAAPSLPFGLHGLGGLRDEPDAVAVPHGATLLLVTDGVTESRNRAGDFYDPGIQLPLLGPQPTARQVVEALRADLDAWTAHSPSSKDDRAVLAVRRD